MEGAVKLVTESALKVCGSVASEGYIRAKIMHVWTCQNLIQKKNCLMWHWSRSKHFAALTFAIIKHTEVRNTKFDITKYFIIITIFCN